MRLSGPANARREANKENGVTEDGQEIIQSNGNVEAWQPLQETPELPPELLTQLIAKTDMMWRETQRRDGNAVWHSWKWMRGFLSCSASGS